MRKRRANDAYYTPGWMVRSLIRHSPLPLVGYPHEPVPDLRIFEPCAGDGAIANELRTAGYRHVWTNDIDDSLNTDQHFDAADPWPLSLPAMAWVISNPPWAMPKNGRPLPVLILQESLKVSAIAVTLLLRITFLEPTANRGAWLQDNPPDQIIVLPRYSFTGDGKSDSATAAWMTWFVGGRIAPANTYRPIVVDHDAERL